MDRLYGEAAGDPLLFRSTDQSTEAVKELARYQGRRATEMLLDIATSDGVLMSPDTQAEAIKALRKRKGPEVSDALAGMLQPSEGLGTRMAAAEALKDMPCNVTCVRSVLHYLERIWLGQSNAEDKWLLPPGNEKIIADTKKRQEEIYTALYSVLRREEVGTLTTLMKVYGLGSTAPSPFALYLIPRLELPEACPILQQSERALKQLSPDSYTAPRQELHDAISSLKCN